MARGVAVIAGAGCSAAAWERAFGSEAERLERFRAAKELQDRVRALNERVIAAADATAIHDDAYWGKDGRFEFCLGARIMSRTHEREYCKTHRMIENTDKPGR